MTVVRRRVRTAWLAGSALATIAAHPLAAEAAGSIAGQGSGEITVVYTAGLPLPETNLISCHGADWHGTGTGVATVLVVRGAAFAGPVAIDFAGNGCEAQANAFDGAGTFSFAGSVPDGPSVSCAFGSSSTYQRDGGLLQFSADGSCTVDGVTQSGHVSVAMVTTQSLTQPGTAVLSWVVE